MHILMISTDRKIFEEGSAVRARMVEYGGLVDELHIIVFSTRKLKIENWKLKITDNVWVYPTNSYSRWLYVFDAICIGRRIYGSFTAHLWLTPLETLRTRSPFTRKRYHQEKSHAKNCRASLTGLITAQDPFETGLAGWIIARVSRTPLQLQIHTDFLNPYFKRHSFVNRVRILIARFLLPKADCIRAVSTRIAESLKSNIKGPRIPEQSSVRGRQMLNVSVLPIYIDAEHIRNAKPAKKPFDFTTTPFVPLEDNARSATGQNVWGFTILWVGRLEPEKNLALALESVAWFLRTHQNAGLVVVGDGGKRAVMERYAALLGLQKHVVFIGWQKDIASWYAAADVLLVTSEYEGYGRHIVEARSAGMPVVSTDVGVARETGSFIADANAQSLAGQLQDVHEGAQAPAYQYPYADTQAYLSALKRAWNTCARRETF